MTQRCLTHGSSGEYPGERFEFGTKVQGVLFPRGADDTAVTGRVEMDLMQNS